MTPSSAGHIDHSKLEIWWAALGAGLVVIASVVILLSLLTAFVRDIERHLLEASHHANGISEHINAGDLIGVSAGLIHDLGDELELQVAVLKRGGGAL